MRALLVTLVLALTASQAHAATAFFVKRTVLGPTTQMCHYRLNRTAYVVKISREISCPDTIEV